jgi:putative endonuclease
VSTEKGREYESRAAEFMLKNGYKIIERNWHAGVYGEIDLICQEDKLLVFVEVKGRSSSNALEDALNSIDSVKARKLLMSMQMYLDYLEEKKKTYSPKVRFDLIVVEDGTTKNIEHFVDVSLWEVSGRV